MITIEPLPFMHERLTRAVTFGGLVVLASGGDPCRASWFAGPAYQPSGTEHWWTMLNATAPERQWDGAGWKEWFGAATIAHFGQDLVKWRRMNYVYLARRAARYARLSPGRTIEFEQLVHVYAARWRTVTVAGI